jgi:hypothetical protein
MPSMDVHVSPGDQFIKSAQRRVFSQRSPGLSPSPNGDRHHCYFDQKLKVTPAAALPNGTVPSRSSRRE